MKVTIAYTYKEDIDVFEHVINIKQTFEYKLGARVDLKIEGKRNKVRIPTIDIRYMTIADKE